MSDNNKIILISITESEFQNLIYNAVREALAINQEKQILSFKEVCEMLNISASCLNKWKSEGKIPYKKLGKRIFFSRTDIKAALNETGNYKKLKELE
uniref:DNA-binding protein n=1 Tax=Ignavibacterium album TaxID=591197 RepID=A0A7V3E899_9BACT